jgi:DegV family protein with EDD domain
MKVLVSSDTSSLVSVDVLSKNGISVFPLNVIVDGKEYLDTVTIDQETLKNEMRNNKTIKTSTPPLGQVIEYFEKLLAQGYDHVIHFTISSKLSSMYNLFSNVANENFPGKVTVIDSYALSAMMLNNVLFAKEEAEKGTSVEDICKAIEERKHKGTVLFIPENLTALKNGGRISPAIAAVGNVIGLKPVITLTEGELVKVGMTTVVKKVFNDHIAKIKDDYPVDEYDYTLVSFDGKEAIFEAIYNTVKQIDENAAKGIVPINVCAHCGPGTIGLLVSPKINGKRIGEFL